MRLGFAPLAMMPFARIRSRPKARTQGAPGQMGSPNPAVSTGFVHQLLCALSNLIGATPGCAYATRPGRANRRRWGEHRRYHLVDGAPTTDLPALPHEMSFQGFAGDTANPKQSGQFGIVAPLQSRESPSRVHYESARFAECM